jgi:hypothetical protein
MSKRSTPPGTRDTTLWVMVSAVSVVVALIAGATWFGISNKDAWKSGVSTVGDLASRLGANELKEGEEPSLLADHVPGAVAYKVIPPVGGNHSSFWASCGFYGRPLQDEAAVHSLEHGAVWFTTKELSLLEPSEMEYLFTLTERNPYVLVSPYPEQKEPFVLSAWGLRLPMDKFDKQLVDSFVRSYASGPQTPERGASCKGGVEAYRGILEAVEKARAAEATPPQEDSNTEQGS